MRRIIWAASAAFAFVLAGCVTARDPHMVRLTDEQLQWCREGHGCSLVQKDWREQVDAALQLLLSCISDDEKTSLRAEK